MTVGFLLAVFIFVPLSTSAKEVKEEELENYGVGILCPKPDTQITFYTENNQQDAAGTIAFDNGAGFIVTSDTVKDLKVGGARTMDKLCENGLAGMRIDSKRDGWLQAGKLWMPPNQEWDYADWPELLRKVPVWKSSMAITLYQGTADAPSKDKPYPVEVIPKRFEIYPLKFMDDYALVVLDENDAYTKSCAGTLTPPKGPMGWIQVGTPDGHPSAVPAHLKGC